MHIMSNIIVLILCGLYYKKFCSTHIVNERYRRRLSLLMKLGKQKINFNKEDKKYVN